MFCRLQGQASLHLSNLECSRQMRIWRRRRTRSHHKFPKPKKSSFRNSLRRLSEKSSRKPRQRLLVLGNLYVMFHYDGLSCKGAQYDSRACEGHLMGV